MKEDDVVKNKNISQKESSMETGHYTLTVYIVMRMLRLIRHQMGLEAMLEYIDKYIEKNENRHPQFPQAFSLAMNKQKLETIYENTVKYQDPAKDS